MNIPNLYHENNGLQRQSVKTLLDEYIQRVQWKMDGGDRIMDIGCGPGDVTVQILLPNLPDSIGELIATDISSDAIQYARSHHPHAAVTYDVLDISTKKLPDTYYENFDHVFSFYCLNWVHDQRQAMENIFRMVQHGGDILLIYIAYVPECEVLLKLARQEFWQPHVPDVRQYMPVHQQVHDVEGTVHAILQDVGFERITCHCRRRMFKFQNFQKYADAAVTVNPFFRVLPIQLRDKYLKEYVEELEHFVSAKGFIGKDGTEVNLPYSVIIVNAMKPLLCSQY